MSQVQFRQKIGYFRHSFRYFLSLELFLTGGVIDEKSSLVSIMAWHRRRQAIIQTNDDPVQRPV